MKNTIEKAKPCPFCGELPEIQFDHGIPNITDSGYFVGCVNEACETHCRTILIFSEEDDLDAMEEAVELWNCRKRES